MADLSTPIQLLGGGWIQGRPSQAFVGFWPLSANGNILKDFRQFRATTGVITDQVVLKTAGGEVPFANGRVWLLRLADGLKAWEGWSDAAGSYTASGLEVGVEYVAVAIDPARNHKTTGAGPVMPV